MMISSSKKHWTPIEFNKIFLEAKKQSIDGKLKLYSRNSGKVLSQIDREKKFYLAS